SRLSGDPTGRRLAGDETAPRRWLGRGWPILLGGPAPRRGQGEHGLANRLGAARSDGRGRARASRGRARPRLSSRPAARARALGRGTLHGRRFPARLLPPLPRVSRVLSALGARALSQPEAWQRRHDALRNVMTTGAVTGLAAEAAIARQAGLLAAAGAGTAEGTERAIRALIEQ